ncbi:GBF-interacting protein 1-like [Typha angustifolia]|uniref:GBF-interacting protein 1-like n=1 Tax=Typha angustifolia TaxID=59011 RepID=UPI003C2E4434
MASKGSGGFRVSIPAGVRKTIQNIKEIAGNHSDEEIYAMLKECSMDPNETAQKLLLQDTFHEVKRKRDKKKESNKESADSRWRPGLQGRGGRGGRGIYSSRNFANDVGGRNILSGKENGVNQRTDKGSTSSPPISLDTENKSSISVSSSADGLANGPANPDHPPVSQGSAPHVSGFGGTISVEESSISESNKTSTASSVPVDAKIVSSCGQLVPGSGPDTVLPSKGSVLSVSGVYASASDPVLVLSLDARSPSAIKRAVGSQRTVGEMTFNKVVSRDMTGSELSSLIKDTSQAAGSSSHGRPSGSRPSSSYSSRSQQLSGSQKGVGPNKEWKPKSTNVAPAQASGISGTSDVVPIAAEGVTRSLSASSSMTTEETISKVEKKLDELQFSDRQHVIIPDHLQVPESERCGLSFGSFDASFELTTGFASGPASEKSSTPSDSESSQGIDETVEEPSSSIQNASSTVQEADDLDHQHSSMKTSENFSSREVEKSSNIPETAESDQLKEEAALAPEGPQYSVVPTVPSYSTFGLMPHMLGNQFAPFETSESQTRDTSRLPNYMVQQPFDMSTNYYSQFYRPTTDTDGRFSPFVAPGASNKYNGNIAVLPAQTGQAAQESGNSVVLSSSGAAPLATQAAGVLQSSIAIPQQPVPFFRQPAGVHISHYPPNYIPYNQYFSPFYVPPPTLHHFLSNTAFPQQPPSGSIYSPGAAAAANPVKYSISQYKPGANTGNPTHVGMPTGYGTYSSSPAGYTTSADATSGNTGGNDDIGASQFKENNVYIAGQQSEGSAVWIPAPGRDLSSMQASSFYGLPPQGQHVAFAPAQAGHGAFGGIYHPSQTVAAAAVHPLLQQSQTVAGAVEMVAPPAGVYQQPQRGQINWTNNY